MSQIFISELHICKVRHLNNIKIPLAKDCIKHLILTGKNGSGKTSVLDSLEKYLAYVISSDFKMKSELEDMISCYKSEVAKAQQNDMDILKKKRILDSLKKQLGNWTEGVVAECNYNGIREKYAKGRFILAYYKADRMTNVEVSDVIEKVHLNDNYLINENPGKKFVKYMVSMKATAAMARQEGKLSRAKQIEDWFEQFENLLKHIFGDDKLKLSFDIENFSFSIFESGHEPFGFNEMSSGYSAVFHIINDLIMRTEKGSRDIEGIVLIDEIETHLHLELQRHILPMLSELFPKIQFIVSTHSPFILSSIENTVIYDLEKGTLVENGLYSFPYEGIVEGYFHADRLSADLSAKLKEYKRLASKENLTDDDCAKIIELQMALDEIPDYLSPDIAAEYGKIKLEITARG